MGLAASQARFLGITARKANCEFKSTRLAQERLELSDQLTSISQEYANALNSTKLVWKNDACTQDFDVNYNLLMMPSAANDYNPYMVTTKSGAIILNSKYIAAAEAAGISYIGGTPSQEGRDKFIAALVPNGLITQETADAINVTNYQYKADGKGSVVDTGKTSSTDEKLDIQGIYWEKDAGMGAEPLSTSVYDSLTLADLAADRDIGKKQVDWLQIYKSLANEGVTDGKYYITEAEHKEQVKYYETATNNAIAGLMKTKDPADSSKYLYEKLGYEDVDEIYTAVSGFKEAVTKKNNNPNNNIADDRLKALYNAYILANKDGLSESQKSIYQQRYNNLANGMDANGNYLDTDGNILTVNGYTTTNIKGAPSNIQEEFNRKVQISQLYYGVRAAALEEQMYKDNNDGTRVLKWADGDAPKTDLTDSANSGVKTLKFDDVFGTTEELKDHKYDGHHSDVNYKDNEGKTQTYTMYDFHVIQNGVILSAEDTIKSVTVSNLLKGDVVLYTKDNIDSLKNIRNAATAILESVAKTLGYGQIGVGINSDETTNNALTQALMMTERIFLNINNAVIGGPGGYEKKSDKLYNDQAYSNAINFNRIGASADDNKEKTDAAVSLSNMVSAFLTYYDNILRGADSPYVVGRGNDKTEGSKTYFVTADKNYTYIAPAEDAVEYNEKMANFYDELYNNLCAYGFRRDDMVEDTEYLQSAIKDGRYSLMSLNMDGYYYQTRYSDTGYLVEEKDQAAITRAEANYTQKKAEITYKEDVIDMRTKTLDAEIAELNAEMTSVQNLITKGIEKVFQMFQGGS